MTIYVPIRTFSEANMREHWGKRAERAKKHRHAVWTAWRELSWCARRQLTDRVAGGQSVKLTLVRVAPRELDAHDNLRAALKACVDQITAELGLSNDRDHRLAFEYVQRRGNPKEYAVEITVEPCTKEAA